MSERVNDGSEANGTGPVNARENTLSTSASVYSNCMGLGRKKSVPSHLEILRIVRGELVAVSIGLVAVLLFLGAALIFTGGCYYSFGIPTPAGPFSTGCSWEDAYNFWMIVLVPFAAILIAICLVMTFRIRASEVTLGAQDRLLEVCGAGASMAGCTLIAVGAMTYPWSTEYLSQEILFWPLNLGLCLLFVGLFFIAANRLATAHRYPRQVISDYDVDLWRFFGAFTIMAVMFIGGMASYAASTPLPYSACASYGEAPCTIGLAQTGSGTLNSGVPLSWGVGQTCTSGSPCQMINFSLSASTRVNTGVFGFKITTTTSNTVTGWIIVLWSANGNDPLAAWSQANETWTAAHGQILPIGGLQDDGVLLISAPGTTLIGSGDTLSGFGTGSGSVSGQTTL